jgi:fatty-acyl-CoA synthase
MKPRSRHFADLLDELVERQPDREMAVHRDGRLTYREMQAQARRAAKGLYALGIRPGDRVALLMSNRLEWLITAFGTFQLGATLVPISTWYRTWDVDHALRHCQARLLILMERFRNNVYLDSLHELAPELGQQDRGRLRLERFPDLERIVLFGAGSPPPGTFGYDEMLTLGDSVPDAALAECRAAARPRDPAYILYTSGSSAAPKGVMMPHFGCLENGFNIGERQHITVDDRLWFVVSLAWSLGAVNGMGNILTHGGCMVLQEYLEPGEALALLAAEQVTAVYTLPNITSALLEHPDRPRHDLSSLRTGMTIGSPAEIRRAIEDLGAREICNAYGGTETYGICTITDADDPASVRATSNGPPLPGMDIRIVDPETGRELPAGQTGEILVRGLIVPGYWNDPENTAWTFKDGAYHSGDLGYFDERGHVHFVGRSKEMIRTGGINVAPAEVEAFLTGHPAVKQAVVVGLPDPEKDEVVGALVQLQPDASLSEQELGDYCRARIAAFKVPQRIRFVSDDEIPRTSTGKVNKREVAELIRP